MTEAQWSARGPQLELPSLAPAGLARVCQFFVKVSHVSLAYALADDAAWHRSSSPTVETKMVRHWLSA